jgi:hypothetical protein
MGKDKKTKKDEGQIHVVRSAQDQPKKRGKKR